MYKIINILWFTFFSFSLSYVQADSESTESSLALEQESPVGFSDPEELMSDLIHRAVDFKNWKKQDDFFVQLENYFDFSYMARFVLGRTAKKIDAEQLQEFIDVFSEIQILSLFPQIKNTASIKLLRSHSKNKKTVLYFSYKTENNQIEVGIFVKKNKDGSVKIYDFQFEAVRMLLTWRTQLNSIIKRQGFEGMMQDLKAGLEKKRDSLD